MTIAYWFLYCTAVSLFLGLAGLAGEAALRAAGRPVRWAWVASIGGSLLLPVTGWLGFFRPAVPAAPPPEPVSFSSAAPVWLGDAVAAPVAVEVSGPAWTGVIGPTLLVVWVAFSALAALGLLLAVARLRRLRAGWRPDVVEGVPVLVSRDLGPAVVGLARGAIVVPEWALRLERRVRRLMLLHEGEHLSAGDTRVVTGALLAVLAMPWNLPLWWQLRRLRAAVELDCDARVLRREPDARAYGTLLLEVGRRRSGLGPVAVALAEPPSLLERRIRWLGRRDARPRVRRAVALGAVAAILAVGSCWVDRPPEPLAPEAGPDAAVVREDPGDDAERDPEGVLRAWMAGLSQEEFRAVVERMAAQQETFGNVQRDVQQFQEQAAQLQREVAVMEALRSGQPLEASVRETLDAVAPRLLERMERTRAAVAEPAAGAGRLTGVVRDAATGQPMAGARVFVEGTGIGALTQENGRYFILGLPAGRYTVVAAAEGRATLRLENVLVTEDVTRAINVELGGAADGSGRIVIEPDRMTRVDVVRAGTREGDAPADGLPVTSITAALAREHAVQERADRSATPQPAEATGRGGLTGVVTDAETSRPIAGARVTLEGTGIGVLTQQNGRYFILNVPEERYNLVVEVDGRSPARRNDVLVAEGETRTVDFAVGPAATELPRDMAAPVPADTPRVPTFTPMTVPPELRNASEVAQEIERAYPPLLRDAGVGGRTVYWLYIDENGRVVNHLVHTSSGHRPLDAIMNSIAPVMQFSPALNRDARVPVWIQLPIEWGARATRINPPPDPDQRPEPPVVPAPLPPPPAPATPSQPLWAAPAFTPMTERPQLRNREAVSRAIQEHYPPLLRDAGVGGRTVYWLFVDETGRVVSHQVHTASGHPHLDAILDEVVSVMEFSPARNHDQVVPVWIELPIQYSAR